MYPLLHAPFPDIGSSALHRPPHREVLDTLDESRRQRSFHWKNEQAIVTITENFLYLDCPELQRRKQQTS